MARVIWTDNALRMLDDVATFIAGERPSSASAFVARAFSVAEQLQDFPNMGRVVPEFGRNDIRERIVDKYRLVYQVTGSDINVLAVHHGARLLSEIPGL